MSNILGRKELGRHEGPAPDVMPILVGAGVVGTGILQAHVTCGMTVFFCDQQPLALENALARIPGIRSELVPDLVPGLTTRKVISTRPQRQPGSRAVPAGSIAPATTNGPVTNGPVTIVIESVVERLDVKRALFSELDKTLGQRTIFCSNTSTLQIHSIGQSMPFADRLMGMHFFMPVDQRPGVEIVRSELSGDFAYAVALRHAEAIGKVPIVVGDGPGFVVNRMLAPYLGKAIELVTSGATAVQLERAALSYGMPLSPLELIDWIGSRTTLEAGRGYWSAFPKRVTPSPLVAGLLKAGRYGRDGGGGFYDYDEGRRSDQLAPLAAVLCETYSRDKQTWTDIEIELELALAMWIEAKCLIREGVVDSMDVIDIAMACGLGYATSSRGSGSISKGSGWSSYFRRHSPTVLHEVVGRPTMRAPEWLLDTLATETSEQ